MKKFITKNKKYFSWLLLFAVVLSFVILPAIALAQAAPFGLPNIPSPLGFLTKIFSGISADALLFVSSIISYIFSTFFGIIIYLEAKIINYMLIPTNFPMTNARIVEVGWGITRDLANMFFILILLIISFATVLRIKSYALNQLLWKVVVAALLINFSLVIAGFVIDFTNILTQFFLKQFLAGGNFWDFTAKMMSNMQILNFYNPARAQDTLGGITQFTAAGIAAFVGIVLTLVGLVVTVFVFGAAMIFLIVRILHIWLLLIIAPIVWVLWILPATSGYFSQWWHAFIKWAFFAPIFVFMIYLSDQIFTGSGQLNAQFMGVSLPANWNESTPGLTTAAMPAAIFQWILVIAMMFGSLIVAQKFGVYGADASQKMLTGWGDKSKNWAGRQLRSRALGVGAKEAAPGVEARPGLLVRGAQKLAAVPGGRLIAGQIFKMTTAEAGTIEAAQKQFANWTPEAIQAYLKKSPGPITNALFQNQQMGAALALKEKGRLDKIGESRIKELAALASRQYPKQLDEILKVAPRLATAFNKTIKEVVAKIDKADEVMTESLSDPNVVMNFNPEQLKTIARKGSDQKVNLLKGVVNAEYEKMRASLLNEFESNADESAFKALLKIDEVLGFKGEKPPSKEARNKALGELGKEYGEKMEKLIQAKVSISSPAWDIG